MITTLSDNTEFLLLALVDGELRLKNDVYDAGWGMVEGSRPLSHFTPRCSSAHNWAMCFQPWL
jgi:hypothetical protein